MGHFSIESYFNSIASLAPASIKIKKVVAPAFSRGLFSRWWIAIHARFQQSRVNHITGDIHFIAPFLKRSKTILTIHDCGQLKIKKGLAYKILKYFWFTLPCKWVKIITVNSEYTKQDVLSYVDIAPDKIKVIPIFVSDIYQRRPEKTFNKEKPIVLQIGTAHNKNIERSIKALENIPCHFKILGKLSEHEINMLRHCQIEYTHIDRSLSEYELYELYQSADLVTFMSTLEGFGMTIVEANQIGIPVITSNLASMPWVAGNAAHLIDPLDVWDMHRGIKKIIDDDQYRNQLVQNGYKNAMRFDRKKIAQEYFEIYRWMAA